MKPLYRLLILQALLALLLSACTNDSPFQPNKSADASASSPFEAVATPPFQIGDQVINDINQNGIIDEGEPGLAGVVVRLYACDASLIAEDTSDANGFYGFAGLDNGSYYVSFAAPAGYVFSSKDQGGDDAFDSDVDPASGHTDCFAYDTSAVNVDIDACLHQSGPVMPAFLGNQVWQDLNGNGRQDGEPGVVGVLVRLRTCSGVVVDSMYTNSLGQYTFPFLNPGVYCVEFVRPSGYGFVPMHAVSDDMMDSDVDPLTGRTECIILLSGQQNFNIDAGLVAQADPDPLSVIGDLVFDDANMDGIQDADESGLPGVSVELFDCGGNLLASTSTDDQGAYQFADLDAGDYSLQFHAPDGFLPSPQNAGSDDGFDSDANPLDGSVACFSLAAGDTINDIDAGFYIDPPPIQRGSIGDFVWEDLNDDGIQDPSEPGVPGIVVNLFACDGSPVAATVTDGSGLYLFDSLLPGDYFVQFIPPDGYEFSPQNTSDNGDIDSDADATTGQSYCISLTDGEQALSIDAGLHAQSEGEGCTHPRIYWKHHTGGRWWADEVSQFLPIWLGKQGGGRSIEVVTPQQAYDILSGKRFGRHYNVHSALYAELLATKLNIANGADQSEVAAAVAHADEYLMDDNGRAWNRGNKGRHNPVPSWVAMLHLYNWGIIGPGNCDLAGLGRGKDRHGPHSQSSDYEQDDFDAFVDQVVQSANSDEKNR